MIGKNSGPFRRNYEKGVFPVAGEGSLWSVSNLKMSIGRQILFDSSAVSIAEHERVAVVGRNGCGKSTFLRIVEGGEKPDGGEIIIRKNLRISGMPQESDVDPALASRDIVSFGFAWLRALLKRYESVSLNSPEHAELEARILLHDAWNLENRLDILLEKLRLDRSGIPFARLSGGEKRRVLLARALASEPDLLLLDEPTNHLDVETVAWIEEFLSEYRGACLFVTHDRYFLDRVATRIVELDHGHFFSCPGSYADFLEMKASREYAEDLETRKRNAFLRREVEWVRRSPKARLKKNLGRGKRFDELAAVKAPERTGTMELLLPDPPRLGNKVLSLDNVSLSLGGRTLFRDFSFEFDSAQKVGIIGPNGTGKTSLLKLMTGLIPPDSGVVSVADTVRFNYIDQSRLVLNPEATLRDEVGGDSDYVDLGRTQTTVRAYLKRFLFEDDRINMQVKYLSGGEKARLVLAKILKQGGNFLILDEPTNDLDLPSLRVLEESLSQFPSTVVVVSHDRYFLNRVCTHMIAFEPGMSQPFVSIGDYDSCREKLLASRASSVTSRPAARTSEPSASPRVYPVRKEKKKLSWAETRELEGMEQAILEAESRVSELERIFQTPDFYARHGHEAARLKEDLEKEKAECERLYSRWEFLENKKKS